MSFKDDLTEQEITNFTNELAESLKKDGFSAVYEMAMKKINEYPCCNKLIKSVAIILEGAMIVLGVEDKEKYEVEIEKLYEKLIDSNDIEVSDSAKTMLISKYTQRNKFEKAQSLINVLSSINEHKMNIRLNQILIKEKLMKLVDLLKYKLIEHLCGCLLIYKTFLNIAWRIVMKKLQNIIRVLQLRL